MFAFNFLLWDEGWQQPGACLFKVVGCYLNPWLRVAKKCLERVATKSHGQQRSLWPLLPPALSWCCSTKAPCGKLLTVSGKEMNRELRRVLLFWQRWGDYTRRSWTLAVHAPYPSAGTEFSVCNHASIAQEQFHAKLGEAFYWRKKGRDTRRLEIGAGFTNRTFTCQPPENGVALTQIHSHMWKYARGWHQPSI